MSHLWQCLEEIPGLVAVPMIWRNALTGSFDVFRWAFLRTRAERAKSFPCPKACGCAHEIVEHDGGALVAVCTCESWNCEDIPLSVEDVVLLELNWQKLGRAIAKGFGCDAKQAGFSLPNTMQVASFSGAALPLVLTIQNDQHELRNVVGQLIAGLRERFVVLVPTGRFVDAKIHGVLAGAKAGVFDLESHLTLTPAGGFEAGKSAGELFSPFIADVKEAASDDEARRLFALVKQLESEGRCRKAPVLQVFRLYCLELQSRADVAQQCGCVESLITLRLKAIGAKLGRHPKELRQLSAHFKKIEDSLSDPRARRIRRQSGIDDGRFAESND